VSTPEANKDRHRGLGTVLRTVLVVALLSFVGLSVGFIVYSQFLRPKAAGKIASTGTVPAGPTTVVYYFHTTSRCPSCLRIESWTRECLEKSFSAELATGKLKWKPIDVQKPENGHFVEDFKLMAKTVVVCNYHDGKSAEWADLIEVWKLLNDKGRFTLFVRTKVKELLTKL